jgi:hypothetical protein
MGRNIDSDIDIAKQSIANTRRYSTCYLSTARTYSHYCNNFATDNFVPAGTADTVDIAAGIGRLAVDNCCNNRLAASFAADMSKQKL